jgi:predicted NBD/HSP70 family sugar kinase
MNREPSTPPPSREGAPGLPTVGTGLPTGSLSRAVLQPEKMRRVNRRALLSHLRALGTASRADLAKALGLSQPTAGKIVDELLSSGVIEEIAAPGNGAAPAAGASARLGRPGRLLRLDSRRPRFLVIRLGVRQTRLAAVPVGDSAEDRWTWERVTAASATEWSRDLRRAAASVPSSGFWGVLVSVPGVVNEHEGRVLFSPNLHWTEQVDLPALIRGVWDAPVLLVQEERALALGHHALEPALDDFLLVDFGEGVGGAVVVDGRPHANPLPVSGELGHTPVPGNRLQCGCGATGCLETLVSQPGLLARFATEQGRGSASWKRLQDHIARCGVVPWLAEVLDVTGAVIAGAVNVLGLRQVVITGSLAELPAVVMEHLAAAIRRGALWGRFGEVVIQSAPRRRIAGLVTMGLDRLVLPLAGEDHLERTSARRKSVDRSRHGDAAELLVRRRTTADQVWK